MFETMKRAVGALGVAVAVILSCAASASAQEAAMQGAKGAIGAGYYPELAKNPKLEAAGYPVTVVLHGLNGMPPVGKMMTDEQVAEVINFLRTHFGNSYEDKVTPQDVAQAR